MMSVGVARQAGELQSGLGAPDSWDCLRHHSELSPWTINSLLEEDQVFRLVGREEVRS